MSERSVFVEDLAERLVAHECADATTDDDLVSALEALFALLDRMMSALVGPLGYRALTARALYLSRPAFPWLATLSSQLGEGFPSSGWDRVGVDHGHALAKACAAKILGQVLCLLCDFIGEDLTLRLIWRTWPEIE